MAHSTTNATGSGYMHSSPSPFLSSAMPSSGTTGNYYTNNATFSHSPTSYGGGATTTSYGGGATTTSYGGATSTCGGQQMQSTVHSERIISSNVVGEQQLQSVPEDSIQYVEVPVIEEKVRYVPKKELVEVERRVPKYEYEWVERVVEVPHIQTVDRVVEVPQVQEVVRRIPKREIIDVPREILRQVPRIETKIVEKIVNVPGEIIEVEKKYTVEKKVVVPRYVDRDIPTVVAQSIKPNITESDSDFVEVDLKEYNPYLVKVDVFVPRPVHRSLVAADRTDEHRIVDVPVEQFNALVKQLNTNIIDQSNLESILVKDMNGAIPVAPLGPGTTVVAPLANADIQGEHNQGQLHYYMTNTSAAATTSSTVVTSTMPSGATRFVTAPAMQYNSSYGPMTTTSISLSNRGIPSTSITHLGGYSATASGFNNKVGSVYYGGSGMPYRTSTGVHGSGAVTPSRF